MMSKEILEKIKISKAIVLLLLIDMVSSCTYDSTSGRIDKCNGVKCSWNYECESSICYDSEC